MLKKLKEKLTLERFKHLFTKEGFLTFLKAFYHSYAWVVILLFVLDIASKWSVQNNLEPGESVTIIPNFLEVTLVYNTGAAFGMGSDGSLLWRAIWIIISIVLSIGLSFFYWLKYENFNKLYRVGVIMMIAGAFGNLIDRAFYWENIVGFNGVIDWIQFIFGSYHFPTFNLADSSLVIGVIILILAMITDLIKDAKKKKAQGVYDIEPAKLEEMRKAEEKENIATSNEQKVEDNEDK